MVMPADGSSSQKQLSLIDQRSQISIRPPVDHRQSADRVEHPLGELRLEYFDEACAPRHSWPRTRA